MILKADWIFEEKRLKAIIGVIEEKLTESQRYVEDFRQHVRTVNHQMWEDITLAPSDLKDLDVMARANLYLAERKQQIVTYNFYKAQVDRMHRMMRRPYFGRIDFQEIGEKDSAQIYIGISTLIDEVTQECLIYDWRASVSSMFYDYEPGYAEYVCPDGRIRGEMCLKRQYKILDGVIQFMFDTNLKIDDEILQTILSQNATGRMKNIVTSIQREQNQVIRDEDHKVLVVQGAAGSGKTSIALHRVAYLLYKYRNTINADNILIFSPNRIFSDYISDVLPELGEENMRQMTFHDYAIQSLGQIHHSNAPMYIEDVTDQLEYLFSKTKNVFEYQTRIAGTKYKSSQEFLQIIKKYIKYLDVKGVAFADLFYQDEQITTRAELEELWQRYKYIPFEKRLYKMRQKILRVISKLKKKRIKEYRKSLGERKDSSYDIALKDYMLNLRHDLLPVKRRLRDMLSYDIFDMYLQLFKTEDLARKLDVGIKSEEWKSISQQTIASFTVGVVSYEDVAPLLYLQRALQGEYPFATNIKHVLIDEAQDYSLFHYEIIRQLFLECHLTVLGDLNQSIHPYLGISNYQRIAELFDEDVKLVELTKSYRSTIEIARFARAILGPANKVTAIENAVNRSGEKPKVFQIVPNQAKQALLAGIESLRQKGAKSIAVICKTAIESEQVYNLLHKETTISHVTIEEQEFHRETVVIPSYLAKGLEFDAVLVYLSEEGNYTEESEVYLLYTVCTRALHYLYIYYLDFLSPMISDFALSLCETNPGV